MKNKGFTLVELVAVIAVIAVISILVFPSVEKLIKVGSNTLHEVQLNTLVKAAYDYTLKNPSYLPESGESTYITLGELKSSGLVYFKVVDPSTKEEFKDNLVISVTSVGNGYSYLDSFAMLQGEYLYKAELDKLNNTSSNPTIDIGIPQNSDGNYITTLNLGDTFNINYTATSHSNNDLTSNVKYYIVKDDSVVDTIDSSKSGIYKINYSVVDSDGNATATTLNVIISDRSKPTIKHPGNTTISGSISSYDLMDGVKCTDNSGFCNITYSTQESSSKKYIVTYTAQDPSGNTGTSKRVITVK